jgi:hypothetical protein
MAEPLVDDWIFMNDGWVDGATGSIRRNIQTARKSPVVFGAPGRRWQGGGATHNLAEE